jgi:uncharacterized protein (DUF302 family)
MTTELGIQATMHGSFNEVIEKTTAALKTEGFGVLTRIDVHTTFKEKLNADFRKYTILGACNPPLAHRALLANADVGLLLPCNVTVQEEGGEVVVTAVDPEVMLGVMPANAEVKAVAEDAKARLERVIASSCGPELARVRSGICQRRSFHDLY